MTLWLVLAIAAGWSAMCAMAVSLCVMAARGDRGDAMRLCLVPVDRHTERRPLRMRREARSDADRLPR